MSTSPTIHTKDIICEIEAMHEIVTGNYIGYTESSIDSSLESWTSPYLKPVILHHKDQDGKIIGRVLKAEKRPSVLLENSQALVLTVRISDETAKQGILDKRYLTTSIGVSSSDVECSICHKPIQRNKSCGHVLGKTYKDQTCTWTVNSMMAKEISFVIVPADSYSQVIKYWYEGEEVAPLYCKERNGKMDGISLQEQVKLQQENIQLKEQIQQTESLKSENLHLKEQANQAQTRIQELEASLQEANQTKDTLLAEASVAETKITQLQEQLENEKMLREAAEHTVAELQENQKEGVIADIMSLREQLEMRTIEKEKYQNKTFEQLQEMLEDLKEDLAFKENKSPEVFKEAKASNENITIQEPQIHTQSVSDIMKNIL